MDPENRWDFVEVFHSATSTILGRLFAVVLAASLGTMLGSFATLLAAGLFSEIIVAVLFAPLAAGFSMSLVGVLIYFPAQFLCALLFGKYELPAWFLAVPALLGLWAGVSMGNLIVEESKPQSRSDMIVR